MELTPEQKETFENLQKPTIEMVASFYGLSAKDVEKVSVSFVKAVAKSSGMTVEEAREKCWKERGFVPKGVTPSGKFMVNAGLLSQEELNAFMEVQAAARIVAHVDVSDEKYPLNVKQGRDFFTPMQHLEVITGALVNDTYTDIKEYADRSDSILTDNAPYLGGKWTIDTTRKNNEKSSFLQKARNKAIATLKEAPLKLRPEVAKQVVSLAKALNTRKGEEKALLSPLADEDIKNLQENTKNPIVQSEAGMIPKGAFDKADVNASSNGNTIGIAAYLKRGKGPRG